MRMDGVTGQWADGPEVVGPEGAREVYAGVLRAALRGGAAGEIGGRSYGMNKKRPRMQSGAFKICGK
jgi:hypothetical protein